MKIKWKLMLRESFAFPARVVEKLSHATVLISGEGKIWSIGDGNIVRQMGLNDVN